jgi:nucleotide-binding universal stress UspA family protein
MTRFIVAFASTDRDEAAVTAASTAVADVLGLAVERRRLAVDRDPRDTVTTVLRDVADPDVVLAALPYSAGHTARLVAALIQRCPKPVLVVPVRRRPAPTTLVDRVLVPLDGTALSANAVAETVGMFCARGADVVVLHVFNQATVPRFWDQPEHARKCWADEFLARFLDRPNTRMEVRSGTPGESIVDVAGAEHADLIALGWAQDLSAGHAATIRTALANSAIPVLLLPQESRDTPPDGTPNGAVEVTMPR